MNFDNALTRRLGLSLPVIQGPMAGGTSTTAMAIAASAAGGLGSVGAAYLSPQQIRQTASDIQAATDKPYAINLFAPQPVGTPAGAAQAQAALAAVAAAHARLGLPAPHIPESPPDTFDAQFDAVLASGAKVFSFTFGIVPTAAIQAAHERQIFVIGTATTVVEAQLLERAGVDAIVAQGGEAGGHRGSFAVPFEAALVGTLALVPQVVDAVSVPVIASGGIMDGRGLVAALALGASAVQMGTAFITTAESGAPQVHKAAILAAEDHGTRVTRAYSGRPARGIENHFMRAVEPGTGPAAILPFPQQNALTRGMRNAAAQQGRPEYLSLWCGQAPRLARTLSTAELMRAVAQEARAVTGRLAGTPPERG